MPFSYVCELLNQFMGTCVANSILRKVIAAR